MPEPDGFSHRECGGETWIYCMGRHVTTLRGRRSVDFQVRLASLDEAARQQLMARLTGNFKRGNERH